MYILSDTPRVLTGDELTAELGDFFNVVGCTSIDLPRRVYIERGTVLVGKISLGEGSRIEIGSTIENTTIGSYSCCRGPSYICESNIGDYNTVGPFAFFRQSTSGNNCIIGSHAEVARVVLHNGVRIAHHCFLADAAVQSDTIVGAGVVFANYSDGERGEVRVGKNVLIGCNSTIVAPIVIGDKAVIGAASIVTKSVAEGRRIIQKR